MKILYFNKIQVHYWENRNYLQKKIQNSDIEFIRVAICNTQNIYFKIKKNNILIFLKILNYLIQYKKTYYSYQIFIFNQVFW